MLNQSDHSFSKQEFDKMNSGEKILRAAKGIIPPEGKAEEEALEELLARMETLPDGKSRIPDRDSFLPGRQTFQQGREKQPIIRTLLPRMLRAAAAVIFIVLGYYTVSTVLGKESIRTEVAEHSSLALPDGTGILLNAATKISWNKNRFAEKRIVSLDGEALFDVTKGDGFTIETKNGTVEVLGTQLNVFSRGDEFRVSCLRGKVRVSSNDGQQVLLPGEEAGLTSSGLVKQMKSDIKTAISWTEGIFYFEDKPLVSIFDELERQFNVTIRYEGGKDRLMTVGFSNKSLREALDVICIPMNLNYEIQPDRKVRISEKK